MRRSWNIVRHADVGSACVDIGQFPLAYLFYFYIADVLLPFTIPASILQSRKTDRSICYNIPHQCAILLRADAINRFSFMRTLLNYCYPGITKHWSSVGASWSRPWAACRRSSASSRRKCSGTARTLTRPVSATSLTYISRRLAAPTVRRFSVLYEV